MWIFLTHRITLHSKERKEDFFKRLNDHAQFSKSLNYFTATIEDYGIKVKSHEGKLFLRNKFARGNFLITLIVSESQNRSLLQIHVTPTIGNIIVNTLLAVFAVVSPFPFAFKLIVVGLLLIFEWIALAFNVWWAKDLFERKLITKQLLIQRS